MLRQKISNKIRITNKQHKDEMFSEKKRNHYKNLARYTFKILKDPMFQHFIYEIIHKENIPTNKVTDIQVKTFPLKKNNGHWLVGRCNKKGVISIFPKELGVLQNLRKKWRDNKVNFFIKCRARATFIHELLHIKYSGKEREVRKLTEKYFKTFIQHKNLEQNRQTIIDTLFHAS